MSSRCYIILERTTSKIVHTYYDNSPKPLWYFSEEEYATRLIHVEVPPEIDLNYYYCVIENGEPKFYLDFQKKRDFDKRLFDEYIHEIRIKRNQLLSASDWIVSVPDAPFTETQKQAWIEYRKALRDLPGTIKSREDIVQWPRPPS